MVMDIVNLVSCPSSERSRRAHGDQGKGIRDRAFQFGDRDTIESVITFRISAVL